MDEHFDVIVAGAGSAGCVLAGRLSEDPSCRVLLLEAGPDYPDPHALPPDIRSGLYPTFSHDWGFATVPDTNGNVMGLPRGRLVGGCSATNATFALRGSPADYDEWAAAGNAGWTFDEVLPFFRKLEHDLDRADEWHGDCGPLPIRRYTERELTPTARAFIESATAAGHPAVTDHNAPHQIGVGRTPVNTIDGARISAALAYLGPARARPNLRIVPGALVDRVLFEGRRAIGVRLADGRSFHAERVVVASGTYGSPAILMRSGLGAPEELASVGIDVKASLRGVGKMLVDHPLVSVELSVDESLLVEGAAGFQALLTLRSAHATAGHDLQVFPIAAGPLVDHRGHLQGASMSLLVSVVKPHSRGSVRLRSADPSAAPIIDPAFLTDEIDVTRMVEGLRIARDIAHTRPLADLVLEEIFPGDAATSDSTLAAASRDGVSTYHHPVGTCRMGLSTDASAVVDARGAVHGIEGLFVIDASIMPTIPAANTNIPTLMVAERCAALLRAAAPVAIKTTVGGAR